jgi:acetyl esterase/lipase
MPRLGWLPRRIAVQLGVSLVVIAGSGGGARAGAQTRTRMIQYSDLTSTPAPAADAREAYGDDPLQFGELRLPKTPGPRPVVVFIHGGCWRAAYDLAHVAAAADSLVRAGYAVWVPEYRRVGNAGGGWPGTFDDIGRAIDHLRVIVRRFPALDTGRVYLVGHSAGGQLALFAASRRAGEGSGGAPLPVAGVVALAPITDLATYGAASGSCNSAVTPLMGGTASEMPDRYRAVSPIERLPIGVPVRIVHGALDPIVPVAQSEAFVERARGKGDDVALTAVPGAGHFDVVGPGAEAWRAVVDALEELAGKRPLR